MSDAAEIFLEGKTELAFMTNLLADLPRYVDVRYILADSPDAMRPMALRTLLSRRTPVVMVFQAHTIDEQKAAAALQDLNDYLSWESVRVPFKIIQFVPEIEVLFFQSPTTLEFLTRQKLTAEMVGVGKAAPRQLIKALTAGKETLELIGRLRPEDWAELRRLPRIADLRSFLLNLRTAAAA
ncbi:hypothetical protein [Bordetella sp. N]|uniref:hypothetical protein n=1 Tax=Bordetella sp. N TaxID=1746199 RepID=UPI000711144C|nr:hypothetical protein [Bordetella sp. N]ALM85331.1 hypothetical protein ASB57_22290 [Bordetella sp. N]